MADDREATLLIKPGELRGLAAKAAVAVPVREQCGIGEAALRGDGVEVAETREFAHGGRRGVAVAVIDHFGDRVQARGV